MSMDASCDGYLRNRFSSHALYWQAFTWAFQLSLLLLSATSGQMWHHAADGIGTNAWGRIVFAFVLVSMTWAMHTLVEPHEFQYQHVASSWCYFSHIVLLVTAYYFEEQRAI